MARSKQNARRGKAKKKEQPTQPNKKGIIISETRGVLSEIHVGRSANAPREKETTPVKAQQGSNAPPENECTLMPASDITNINKFALRLIDQRLTELIASFSKLSLGDGTVFVSLEQVPTMYETCYGISLDHRQLGYSSLTALVEDLPGVDIYRSSSPSSSAVCEYMGRHISPIAMEVDDSDDSNNNSPSLSQASSTKESVYDLDNANTHVEVCETAFSIASKDNILPTGQKLAGNIGILENSDAVESPSNNAPDDESMSDHAREESENANDDTTDPMDHDSEDAVNLLDQRWLHHRLVGQYRPLAFSDRVGIQTTNISTTPAIAANPDTNTVEPTEKGQKRRNAGLELAETIAQSSFLGTSCYQKLAIMLAPPGLKWSELEESIKQSIPELPRYVKRLSHSHPEFGIVSLSWKDLIRACPHFEYKRSRWCLSNNSSIESSSLSRDASTKDYPADGEKRRAAGKQLAKIVARDLFPKTSYYNELLSILSASPTGLRKPEISRLIPELDGYLQAIARANYEPIDYLSLGDLLHELPAIQKTKQKGGKHTYSLANSQSSELSSHA